MSHDKDLFELVRHPLKVRFLTVARVVELTPHMKRITLSGPELAGFTSLAPEDHVKIFFPRPGEDRPAAPTFGPLGVPLPSLGPKPIGRDYTPRRYDAALGELDIDFFLHGGGVAARWAAQAAPGHSLAVAGPRGSFVLRREMRSHVFVADETAWPEIVRRIEELPTTTSASVVAVCNGPSEEQPLPNREGVTVRWVHRPTPDANVSEALVAAVRTLSVLDDSPGGAFVWLAGEASEVGAVYRHLLRERGVPKSYVHASGHWKRGVVAHDHHEPIQLEDR